MEKENHSRVFRAGRHENPKFWSRFGGRPDVAGKSVLDLGCGTGSLAIDIAEAGAASVLAIDINEEKIEWAKKNLEGYFSRFKNIVTYNTSALEDISPDSFDVIVSKDTFEHIENFEGFLKHALRILKPGGKYYSGFGPLYRSPFGFHKRLKNIFPFLRFFRHEVPWIHLLFPDRVLLGRHNKIYNTKFKTMPEYGLNKMKFSSFMESFKKSGFMIERIRVNSGNRTISRLFSIPRRIPVLTEFFTYNAYVILKK
ncbi:MAG: class I SAM-dependent methyltransferase [Promethearchaeota archaeon]